MPLSDVRRLPRHAPQTGGMGAQSMQFRQIAWKHSRRAQSEALIDFREGWRRDQIWGPEVCFFCSLQESGSYEH